MDRTVAVRWEDWSGRSIQHLVLREGQDGIVAEAAILGLAGDFRFAAHLDIRCDTGWRVRRVSARLLGEERRIDLSSDGAGHWRDAAGQPQPALDGCIDIDFPVTPFTNTLPIRRLGLRPGQSADLRMVYIHVPELTVIVDPQRYTCLEPLRRYRYESLDSDFTRDIEVDSDGLVVTYPDLFRRIP